MTMPATGTDAPKLDADPKDAPDDIVKDDVQETSEEKAARLEAENAIFKANSRKWEDRAKANKAKAD